MLASKKGGHCRTVTSLEDEGTSSKFLSLPTKKQQEKYMSKFLKGTEGVSVMSLYYRKNPQTHRWSDPHPA